MRVVIGEDETLLREGLVMLHERAGIEVAAAVGDADSLLAESLRHRPDVVVTDIRMPPTLTDDGLRAALAIRELLPTTGTVILSQRLSRHYAQQLLGSGRAGAGYLWKQRIADPGRFVDDVRAVANGSVVLDPDLVSSVVDRAARLRQAQDGLTPRQREILGLVAQGRSNAAIATALFITEKSVVEHVSKIYDAYELPQTGNEHRRVLAVLRFLRGAECSA